MYNYYYNSTNSNIFKNNKMKKLLLLLLLTCGFTQAQTLQETFKKFIQPTNTAKELLEGIEQLEKLCETTPQEKCDKAKAMAFYLLSDKYYQSAYAVYQVDQELGLPIKQKADEIYQKANALISIENFSSSEKNMMLDNKNRFETKYK
jgi:hypothetical protein